MKRIFVLFLVVLFVLSGCSSDSSQNTVEVEEKMFVAQINEIFTNYKNYLGKTIQLEGMFKSMLDQSTNTTYYMVYRNGPGCCGSDGTPGFEVEWDKSLNKAYPKDNDWVEAVGVLEEYKIDDNIYIRLKLKELNVLEKRGLETVAQ